MMKRLLGATLGAFLLIGITAGLSAAAVIGDYIEVRSADIYTGPCFANSQVDLEGKQAILAWKVQKGAWHGVNLNGLSVVAVVEAKATLGDPYHNPYPANTVLIIDQRASASERLALEGMVKSDAGELVGHVVRIDSAPIQITVGQGSEHGTVDLEAGNLVSVRTRSLCAGDHICGNEEVYYPPLAKVEHAMPAFTLEDAFHGAGLGTVWTRADNRSAFIGSFAL